MKTSVLEDAIAAAVDKASEPLNKRISALEQKLEDFGARDLEKDVEATIAKMLGGCAPAKKKKTAAKTSAAAAEGEAGDCGHKNSMSKCPSCRAKKAAAGAAA